MRIRHLPPKAGTQFIDPGGMQGWVVRESGPPEPATCQTNSNATMQHYPTTAIVILRLAVFV